MPNFRSSTQIGIAVRGGYQLLDHPDCYRCPEIELHLKRFVEFHYAAVI